MKTSEDVVTELRELLPPGSTVWTTVTHVARSGMTRWIRLFVMGDGEPRDISWMAARVLGRQVNNRNHEGIECGGCGMDMGFEVVYSLSRHLYAEGYDCLQYTPDGIDLLAASGDRSRKCPSNAHVNAPVVRVFSHHTDGYAISQRWL